MASKRKIWDRSREATLDPNIATAPCVPAIRNAVAAWRKGGYQGASSTTRELLNYWFFNDHRLSDGRQFSYHTAQREAIETLIYVYEIEKMRTRKGLLEKFAVPTKNLRLPSSDDFARYCIKMATGSGKTLVMALVLAWQYFNAVRENENEFAKTFLLVAPNVIVFERLRTDFEGGNLFKTLPLFPKHYELFWDFEFYMREDPERTDSTGALYLTNIQQFYEREMTSKTDVPEVLTALLGGKPLMDKQEITDFDKRIGKRDGLLMILNDEAHHTHDEENEWNAVVRRLHRKRPLSAQLDFSATPRYTKGSLFAWTVFDYPLKQAIIDGIVKRPVKGISKIDEAKSTVASVKYSGFLTAAVERWKEYREQLALFRKKPILFVMMNSTDDAEDVGDWLRIQYPELFGKEKTLIIHTNTAGEISKKDLKEARTLAREVDDDESAVNAIVSVLMLREGWDVKNVTVVVGLRPYNSKAKILPEQTIGRGLRLMFRGEATGYQERVDIIGNTAFLQFVEELEKIESLEFNSFEIGKDKLQIFTIMPMEQKKEYDIGVPDLSPSLVRKKSLAEEIASLDVMQFKIRPLPLKEKDLAETKTFIYEGRDILTDEKLLEREYEIPPVQTAEEVIGYYARRIAQNVKLPSQFAALAPKVREFFERKAFGQVVDLNDKGVINAMSSNIASYVVVNEFEKALRELIIEEKKPELLTPHKLLSTTSPFPFSKFIYEASKSVFNYVACANEYEKDFAKFLQSAEDVSAFAKLPIQFGFCIEYTDTLANIRHYFPDFVLTLKNGEHWIAETKGREDLEVKLKDEAAKNWCSNATELTETTWNYMKISQKEFEKLCPDHFEDLKAVFVSA